MILYTGEAMNDVLYSVARTYRVAADIHNGCVMCKACGATVRLIDEGRCWCDEGHEGFKSVYKCSCHSVESVMDCEMLHVHNSEQHAYVRGAYDGGVVTAEKPDYWKYKEA